MARRIRSALLLLTGLLFVLSIPWYREPGAASEPGWLGLPDWVGVALLCYVGAAVLNSVAWMLTEIPDEGPEPPDSGTPQ